MHFNSRRQGTEAADEPMAGSRMDILFAFFQLDNRRFGFETVSIICQSCKQFKRLRHKLSVDIQRYVYTNSGTFYNLSYIPPDCYTILDDFVGIGVYADRGI